MRICVLGRADYPLLQQRVRTMASLGHDVHVVSVQRGSIDGCHVHSPPWIAPGRLRYLAAAPWARRCVRRLQPQVVDAHALATHGLYGMAGGRTPLVVTVYGPVLGEPLLRHPVLRSVIRRSVRGADLVFASTAVVGPRLAEVLGVTPRRFEAHSWGIPLAELDRPAGPAAGAAIRSGLGCGPETAVVLHNRQFVPHWRVHEIIEAIPLVLARRPDTQFWFSHRPPNAVARRSLALARRRVDELGIDPHVRFLGSQTYAQMVAQLHAADVYLCVGHDDLLAASLLEAMFVGLIPVVSRVEAYSEVLRGDNAFVVDPVTPGSIAASLIDVLPQRAALKERLVAVNAPLIRQHHDVVPCVQWMLDRYEELAGRAAAPPRETPAPLKA